LRQFILPPDFEGQKRYRLGGKDAHYVSRVLRLVAGEGFDARDARGRLWEARVASVEAGSVLLELSPRGAPSGEAADASGLSAGAAPMTGAACRLSLFQCLPKAGKMDSIVRQAVEAGVFRVQPLFSEHSLPKRTSREERWERIVKEARQQSGSPVDTRIEEPKELREAVEEWKGRGPGFFFHERPLAESSLHRYLNSIPAELAVLVGPEGGLSPSEVAFLLDAGWRPVHLGANVLRADTAAIYAIAAVQILLLEHETWTPILDSRQKE
jgi:16S rRNA (uracil1498-N3)-methyltransferase